MRRSTEICLVFISGVLLSCAGQVDPRIVWQRPLEGYGQGRIYVATNMYPDRLVDSLTSAGLVVGSRPDEADLFLIA